MKICLPTVGDQGMKARVYEHFGSAPFFTMYDTESDKLEVLANDNEHHAHGTCQPLSVISKHSVDIVMTNGMGKRAVQLLNDGGVKVYLLSGETVEKAIAAYKAGEMTELTSENACGGHGSGHSCH